MYYVLYYILATSMLYCNSVRCTKYFDNRIELPFQCTIIIQSCIFVLSLLTDVVVNPQDV